MPDSVPRRSPIHHLLEERGAEFRDVGDALFAVHFPTEKTDPSEDVLTICDLSGLRKIGIKGRDAEAWLTSNGLSVPEQIFDTLKLSDGTLVARIGTDEFFLEDGTGNRTVSALAAKTDPIDGDCHFVEHEEATFLLTGTDARSVLAQTCGLEFRATGSDQVVYTRVAGVSCGILHRTSPVTSWRFWADPSYAEYLWEILVEICEELDGRVISAAVLFPELRQ